MLIYISFIKLQKKHMPKKITVSTIVNIPLSQARSKRNTPADIMIRNHASDDRHCPAASNDLKIGGRLSATMAAKDWSFSFDFGWEYIYIEDQSLIQYIMDWDDRRMVLVNFDAVDANSTEITEVFDIEKINSEELQKAWRQAIIDNFKKYVEKK